MPTIHDVARLAGVSTATVSVTGRIVFGWKFIEKSVHEAVARTLAGQLATCSIQPGEPTGASLGGALEVVIEQRLNKIVAQTLSAA